MIGRGVNVERVVIDGTLRQWWDDATRRYHEYTAAGVETLDRPYTPEENADADARAKLATEATNEADLLAKARNAINGNKNFLAIASPTNAQTVTQVKALTRQMNALIRLEVRELLDTSGT